MRNKIEILEIERVIYFLDQRINKIRKKNSEKCYLHQKSTWRNRIKFPDWIKTSNEFARRSTRRKKRSKKRKNELTRARELIVWSARKEQCHVPRKQASRQALDANPVAKKRNAKWAERAALSSFGARAEQISIRRFQTRRRFLPREAERCTRLHKPQPHVRPLPSPVARESFNFETTTTTMTTVLYLRVRVNLSPSWFSNKEWGEGRKDETLTRFEALENEGRFRFACSYSRHSRNK